jgi:hypothetical protein
LYNCEEKISIEKYKPKLKENNLNLWKLQRIDDDGTEIY